MKIINEASIENYSKNLSKERAKKIFDSFGIRSSEIKGNTEEAKAIDLLRKAYSGSQELGLAIEAPMISGKDITIDLKEAKAKDETAPVLNIEKIKQYISLIIDSAIELDVLNVSPEDISISGKGSQVKIIFP